MTNYQKQGSDFLAATGTKLATTFKEFSNYFEGEKNKRNIFNCTLSNSKHTYKFTFGQSVKNSTIEIEKPQTEINDTIDIYAGASFIEKKFSIGRSFKITKNNDFTLPHEEIEKMALEMQNEYISHTSNRNKAIVEKFNKGEISRNVMMARQLDANTPVGAFEQCITRAIERECKKLIPVNIEGGEKVSPTAYDVLACLTKYEVGTFDNFCSDFGYDADSRKAYKTYKAVLKEWKNVELLFTSNQLELLQEID